MTDEYDPHADAIGSWTDTITAMRERFRIEVAAMAPYLWRIRRLRRISRSKLAVQLGVSSSLIQAWETRRKLPPADLFQRWRDIIQESSAGVSPKGSVCSVPTTLYWLSPNGLVQIDGNSDER
jgi:transcriptional regulator with XRE-family HTH domain